MVTTLNITLDDRVADKVRKIKQSQNLTWAEFIEEAGRQMQAQKAPQRPRETAATESTPEPPTDERAAENGTGDRIDRYAEEVIEQGPPNRPHGKEAISAIWDTLREAGECEVAELKAAGIEAAADSYPNARVMWNSLDRYLEDLPGATKSGYGEWAFDEGAARAELEAADS
jgi:hypothetical protein